ncbi:MAG: GDCCVxC domain-containing (seleno)protein [Patescibacteria group bacterium]
MTTIANLTCPKCNFTQKVEMPVNACQHFYKCINCGEIIKPKDGDCCVFCSYADVKCPPKQLEAEVG